ncbi:MAG TPA: rhodanese-like domain-containing protein [Leucothrix mucor]|nr:rhodanese-like domain-containing protein [Leucothrix mucor]
MAKTFKQLIADILPEIEELFPWDLEELLEKNNNTLLVDIREIDEFESAYIKDSLHVPRGILESACDWGYADTIPELVNARERPVIVICRSGNRSALAAFTMQLMGYSNVTSLQTGIKGWNDSDLPLLDAKGESVDPDWADEFFNPPVREEQLSVV